MFFIGDKMRIRQFKDLENCSCLYTGGWFLGTFRLEEMYPLKFNEKSIKFKVKATSIHFDSHKVTKTSEHESTQTIRKDDILYSKIPYFTTKQETIKYFTEELENELVNVKEKVKILPQLINEFKLAFKDNKH